MTSFSEFMSQVTIDQVNDWWKNFAPEKAPEKEENQNWKYWISKNGKSLPFKYVVRSIAESIGTVIDNFGSDDNTRNQFCNKFGFEIDEELVFDIGEKKRFIDHYMNNVDEKDNFQNFLNYASDVVEKVEIKPYNVRMAINAKAKILVVISMRNVLSYSEKDGKSIIGFIIPQKIHNGIKSTYKTFSSSDYDGGDGKAFIEIEVENWKDIPEKLLFENLAEINAYYDKEKQSKLIRWNSEAKTSNSVIKYLIFKREQ